VAGPRPRDDRARRQATDFYQLIVQNKRARSSRVREVAKAELTPTEARPLRRAFDRAKNELSLIAYQTGLDYTRTGRWQEAAQQLRESLTYKSDAAHAPSASYELARSLIGLGMHRDASDLAPALEASAIAK
jgi:TolA-binding protein